MDPYKGDILSGQLSKENESFYLTAVKSIETGSDLSLTQLNQLRDYIVTSEDNFMLTINDQIPLLLKNEEVTSLYGDICKIIGAIQS